MTDEKKSRRERARGLREEIRRLTADGRKRRPPRSPHEFVEEQMREKDREKDERA